MRSLGLLMLRLTFGSLIALHGFPRLFGGPGKQVAGDAARLLGPRFNEMLQQGGVQQAAATAGQAQGAAPSRTALASAGAEFFGGLALILGWHTRLAALALLADMVTILRKGSWEKGIMAQDGAEGPLLFLGAFLTLFLAGPGKLSLDRG